LRGNYDENRGQKKKTLLTKGSFLTLTKDGQHKIDNCPVKPLVKPPG
jgi:hypothetical protein